MILDRHHLVLYAIVILALFGAGYYWHQQHEAIAITQARSDTLKEAQAQLKVQLDEYRADEEARNKILTDKLADMAKAAAQQKTPIQITGWSQAQLEQAIAGIKITVPAPTADNPHPQAVATIPESSLPALRDTIEKCKEDSLRLSTCQQDISGHVLAEKNLNQQLADMTGDRDNWRKTAKGGTWLKRAWNSTPVKIGIFAGGVLVGSKIK